MPFAQAIKLQTEGMQPICSKSDFPSPARDAERRLIDRISVNWRSNSNSPKQNFVCLGTSKDLLIFSFQCSEKAVFSFAGESSASFTAKNKMVLD